MNQPLNLKDYPAQEVLDALYEWLLERDTVLRQSYTQNALNRAIKEYFKRTDSYGGLVFAVMSMGIENSQQRKMLCSTGFLVFEALTRNGTQKSLSGHERQLFEYWLNNRLPDNPEQDEWVKQLTASGYIVCEDGVWKFNPRRAE